MQPVATQTRQTRQMRLTHTIMRWVLVDLGGLVLLLLGGLWLAAGVAVVPGFPANSGQAWFCVALGFALMLYAVVEILKEFLTQRPTVANSTKQANND